MDTVLPRVLIVDDLCGRVVGRSENRERTNLCGHLLLRDVTGDRAAGVATLRVNNPTAEAVFCRGQLPVDAGVGGVVENDLFGTLGVIRRGWTKPGVRADRWSLLLLDLCFYTGQVTSESDRRIPGVPEGRPGDDEPRGFFGLDLLRAIHSEFPDLPVVVLSSTPREEVSRDIAALGVHGFLSRSDDRAAETLREMLWKHGLIPDESGGIVGRSRPLMLALRAARRASGDRRNVLLRGERGTGKELLARYLHRVSPDGQSKPFEIVDSGTLTPQLYASELFGHRRGAYTGADADRTGRIVLADKGDLFLDEVGNMSSDVQAGLLRVLEHHQVAPLGSSASRAVDVRFLSATNEDLDLGAATGGFRQDLLDRLREGGTIVLAPLRERREDIRDLAEVFVRQAEQSTAGALRRTLEPDAVAKLESYEWPGNVRELRTCIFNAVAQFPDVEHLVPVHLRFNGNNHTKAAEVAHSEPACFVAPEDTAASSLAEVMEALRRFDGSELDAFELLGKLPELERRYSGCVGRLLRTALWVTRRITPENPGGELLIHPALKLLTGNKTLSAASAADILKRLLGGRAGAGDGVPGDPILREAYDRAIRLRPPGGARKPGRPG
jgi:DNA-binding NtrC family response regulator